MSSQAPPPLRHNWPIVEPALTPSREFAMSWDIMRRALARLVPPALTQTVVDALEDMDAGQASDAASALSAVRYVAQALDPAEQAQGRGNLGAGAAGGAAFTAADRFEFLTLSELGHSFGAVADDTAVSLSLPNQNMGMLIGFHGGTASRCGLLGVRVAGAASGVAVLAAAPGLTVNGYSTPLSGTTGADNSLNFWATVSQFGVENRQGFVDNLSIVIMRVQI